MFDMGFFELLLIAVVALLVIGPERLPGAVRTAGLWIGRIKRMMRDTRAGLEEQLGADDIRRQLHNEEVMRSLQASDAEVQRTVNEQINEPVTTASNNTAPSGSSSEQQAEGKAL